MSLQYLDTSGVVKLYVREPGTDEMLRLANPVLGHSLYVLGLTRIEFRSAVRMRERLGDIDREVAKTLIVRMEQHFRTMFLIQLVTDTVLDQAAALLDKHPLRAYDAMQLAGCLTLQSHSGEGVTFVCSDQRLLRAAASEGLLVFDPTGEFSL